MCGRTLPRWPQRIGRGLGLGTGMIFEQGLTIRMVSPVWYQKINKTRVGRGEDVAPIGTIN